MQLHLKEKLNTKLGAGVVGGLVGASTFGLTLFAAPAFAHAAIGQVASTFALVLGQTIGPFITVTSGIYLTAMVAVGVAAVLASALLAIAIQMLVKALVNKFANPPADDKASLGIRA